MTPRDIGQARDSDAVASIPAPTAKPVPARPEAAPISTEHKAYVGGVDLTPVVPKWGQR